MDPILSPLMAVMKAGFNRHAAQIDPTIRGRFLLAILEQRSNACLKLRGVDDRSSQDS